MASSPVGLISLDNVSQGRIIITVHSLRILTYRWSKPFFSLSIGHLVFILELG